MDEKEDEKKWGMLAVNIRMWAVNVRQKVGIVKTLKLGHDGNGEHSETDEAE
jgi:hypothetical protein